MMTKEKKDYENFSVNNFTRDSLRVRIREVEDMIAVSINKKKLLTLKRELTCYKAIKHLFDIADRK